MMIQFHCIKCKGTWKKEEDKPNIIYRDGICGDCHEVEENSNDKPIQDKQDLLLKPEELNNAVFMDDSEGGLVVKPDAYLEVAKAQLAKVQKAIPDREVVAKALWLDGDECIVGSVTDVCWREMPLTKKEKWCKKADRIIALTPDEENLNPIVNIPPRTGKRYRVVEELEAEEEG